MLYKMDEMRKMQPNNVPIRVNFGSGSRVTIRGEPGIRVNWC